MISVTGIWCQTKTRRQQKPLRTREEVVPRIRRIADGVAVCVIVCVTGDDGNFSSQRSGSAAPADATGTSENGVKRLLRFERPTT